VTVVRPRDEPSIDLRDRAGDLAVQEHELAPYLVGRLISSTWEVQQARRLHAATYLSRGFVTTDEVLGDGTLDPRVDPWTERSTYFAVRDGDSLVATSRQISTGDLRQMPALRLADQASATSRAILRLGSGQVVEISGLARRPDAQRTVATALYVRMWRHSIEMGHRAWVMAVDLPLYQQLRKMICGEALHPLGPQLDYMGSTVVPAAMFLDETSREHRRLASSAGRRWPICRLLPSLFVPHADRVRAAVG
jgi:hypothetical protein